MVKQQTITLTMPDNTTHTFPTLRAVAFALAGASEDEVWSISFVQDRRRVSWVMVWREMQGISNVQLLRQ